MFKLTTFLVLLISVSELKCQRNRDEEGNEFIPRRNTDIDDYYGTCPPGLQRDPLTSACIGIQRRRILFPSRDGNGWPKGQTPPTKNNNNY